LHENALRRGYTAMAELLVRYGATPSQLVPDAKTLLAGACFQLDRAAARALVEKHPDFLTSTEVIFDAAKRDRADVVRLLLDLGMSPDVEDREKQRPLHMAAYANSLNVAQLLIARGAAIDPVESNWQNTPLGAAAYAQHAPMIELLGRYSRDVWELAYAGNIERLRAVLDEEPERAKVVAGGHTPLMWLPPDDEWRALEIAQLLLAHGTDPSPRNKEGETAADRAERIGMFDLAHLLREAS
jgi:ankyrin repeat protein